MMKYGIVAALLCAMVNVAAAETVRFKAADNVTVTADTGGSGNGPVIVLFHMAGASRGEYRDIAPKFHALGYRTLAVDQRSGGSFNNVANQTAAGVGSDPGFEAAIPDLKAAVGYARDVMGAGSIGVLGSSYSASLVLVLAGRDAGFADVVMSFSPGEYFSDRTLVSTAAASITVPVFLTAARSEQGQIAPLANAIPGSDQVFAPKGGGRHGASSLFSADADEYWTALQGFLAANFPSG